MFTFLLSPTELAPILQMQQVAFEDTVLRNFQMQALLHESILKRQRQQEQAGILAQAAGEAAEKMRNSHEKAAERSEKKESHTYVISYYNPELHKAEILETKSDIRIKDTATRAAEEAAAAQSLYPIYRYIGFPLLRQEVLPWKLERILSEREYGTPPSGGAGASVSPVPVIVRRQAEIEVVKRRDEYLKEALAEAIRRKERSELKVGEEIVILEETVAAIRGGGNVDRLLERLPALSRARYIIALRKKQLGTQVIIDLLLKDARFLKMVKKKLEMFTIDDLLDLYRMLRGLQKR